MGYQRMRQLRHILFAIRHIWFKCRRKIASVKFKIKQHCEGKTKAFKQTKYLIYKYDCLATYKILCVEVSLECMFSEIQPLIIDFFYHNSFIILQSIHDYSENYLIPIKYRLCSSTILANDFLKKWRYSWSATLAWSYCMIAIKVTSSPL